MRKEEMNSKLRDALRAYIDEVADDPSIKQEKAAFIEANFSESPAPAFHVGMFVPAMALCLMMLAVTSFLNPGFLTGATKHQTSHEPAILQEAKQNIDKKEVETKGPIVKVKRITSQVGPTMIYQKKINDVPVTIIWVFAGGA